MPDILIRTFKKAAFTAALALIAAIIPSVMRFWLPFVAAT